MATENRLSLTIQPKAGGAVTLAAFAGIAGKMDDLLRASGREMHADVAWTVVALAVGEDGAVTITVEGR